MVSHRREGVAHQGLLTDLVAQLLLELVWLTVDAFGSLGSLLGKDRDG